MLHAPARAVLFMALHKTVLPNCAKKRIAASTKKLAIYSQRGELDAEFQAILLQF